MKTTFVPAEKKSWRKMQWLFKEGEHFQIVRKTIKEEKDGSIVVPGIKNLDHFNYLIKVGLEWGGQYLKDRAKRIKKLTANSTI